MTALKRFLVVVVAYVLTAFVGALGGSFFIQISSNSGDVGMAFVAVLGFAGIFIGIFATIPSVIMIMIAEYFRVRTVWYYVAIAVIAGLLLSRFFSTDWWMALAGVAMGVISGSVYWAIAGRKAGILKTPETVRAQIQLLLLLGATIVVEAVLLLIFMR